VITFGIEKPDQIDRALESIPTSAIITGFFLGLNKQALHLIFFFSAAGTSKQNTSSGLKNSPG